MDLSEHVSQCSKGELQTAGCKVLYARFLQNKSSNTKQVDLAMNGMVCQ